MPFYLKSLPNAKGDRLIYLAFAYFLPLVDKKGTFVDHLRLKLAQTKPPPYFYIIIGAGSSKNLQAMKKQFTAVLEREAARAILLIEKHSDKLTHSELIALMSVHSCFMLGDKCWSHYVIVLMKVTNRVLGGNYVTNQVMAEFSL